jgi:tRNA G46 methylase TrmB
MEMSGSSETVPAARPPRSAYAHKLGEFPELVFANDRAFSHRGHWGEFFQRRMGAAFDGRVVVEVGCFDAAYLSRVAARHPRTGFVGLDWKVKAVYDGARRVADLGLRNVALLRGRAQDVGRIFGGREVDDVWVFHPDPCDRPAELKNRLIAEPFLADVHAILRDGASRLSLKTDHPGYYQWVLGLFGLPEPAWFRAPRDPAGPRVRARDLMPPSQIPAPSGPLVTRFKVLANSPDFWNDPAVLAHTAAREFAGEVTLFEDRFVRKRLPIYYFEIGPK